MSDEPPPLGVYIHWPYCARICPYCDFAVVRDRGRRDEQAALVDAIATDLREHARLTGLRRLVSIFFGGGTPSLMEPDWAARLIETARTLWPAADDPEVTLEANPTDAEAGRFAAFAGAGVNRLSLGVQALDDAALAFLGRNHDAATALHAAETAARAFRRLSLDLISALPGQSEAQWIATLLRAAALGAEHLSTYQLTIETGTPFDRAVRRGRLAPADPELAAGLYEATTDTLCRLGFEAYEVSNHARGPAARSRHNLIYWRGEDYVGVGPSAHGRISTAAGRLATESHRKVADYLAAVAEYGRGGARVERLDAASAAEERVMMGLRLSDGVTVRDLADLGRSAAAERLVGDGFLKRHGGRLAATARGRLVLDHVTGLLLA